MHGISRINLFNSPASPSPVPRMSQRQWSTLGSWASPFRGLLWHECQQTTIAAANGKWRRVLSCYLTFLFFCTRCGEGIISIKPRPKSAHDFLGFFVLLHCFLMYLCCLLPLRDILSYCYGAIYSLFVLKVPLNPKQTNKQFRGTWLNLTLSRLLHTNEKYWWWRW